MSDQLCNVDGPNQTSSEANDYLTRAEHACETGDLVLGMCLYLAAYEKAAADPNVSQDTALAGLQEAWRLACSLRERSMAEYVFEKLEPFLHPDEVSEYASELQDLALDRLEQFGFSRDDLEEMAESIASDLFSEDGMPMHFESFVVPVPGVEGEHGGAQDALDFDEDAAEEGAIAPAADEADELFDEDAPAGVFGAVVVPGVPSAPSRSSKSSKSSTSASTKPHKQQADKRSSLQAPEKSAQHDDALKYSNLVGYDEAIALMRDFGVGMQQDLAFQNFVSMMNTRHGLSQKPALDTVLFRADAIEDASRFLEATVGEIGLPVLRMTMEEGVQGMPVLCVSTQDKRRPRMNRSQNRFEGPSILIIDDLDTWSLPMGPEGMEHFGGFVAVNISRGAREAISLIRSAVEDPRVFVFATASTSGEVDPFFYELIEPMTVIDISHPTETERNAIWSEIMSEHPSLRELDKSELTRLSAGLSRFDIYMAAREALEEAYKTGMMNRMFVPVSRQNIYDKLASCFPLDSDEYQVVEDEVVESFRADLDHLEDLINPAAPAHSAQTTQPVQPAELGESAQPADSGEFAELAQPAAPDASSASDTPAS